MKYSYAVTTYGRGSFFNTTMEHIPEGSSVMVVDNKETGWPLAKAWNHIVDKVLWDQACDAVIIMNDDVVLRSDTGDILVYGMLEGQFVGMDHTPATRESYLDYWLKPRPELLLLSARHAHWSDACTDEPDWEMLNRAEPIWQPGPDFSCFCISRRLGQVIGRFDENYNPAYLEDNDTHRRIQLAGYEAGALAPYWHFRNGTLRTSPERAMAVQGSFENCKRYYCAKWGAPYDSGNPVGRETFLTPFNK